MVDYPLYRPPSHLSLPSVQVGLGVRFRVHFGEPNTTSHHDLMGVPQGGTLGKIRSGGLAHYAKWVLVGVSHSGGEMAEELCLFPPCPCLGALRSTTDTRDSRDTGRVVAVGKRNTSHNFGLARCIHGEGNILGPVVGIPPGVEVAVHTLGLVADTPLGVEVGSHTTGVLAPAWAKAHPPEASPLQNHRKCV